MSKPLIQRPQADRDIDEFVLYLTQRAPAAASAFLDAVERVYELLGERPGIGSTRHAEYFPDMQPPLRFFPVSGSKFPHVLIYYLDRPDAVEIIRVWDAARGLDALMDDTDAESDQ